MIDATHCRICGQPHGFGAGMPLILLRDDALIELNRFMSGDADNPICEVCSTPFTFSQSFALIFERSASILLAPGDRMKLHYQVEMPALREAIENAANEIGNETNWKIEEFESIDALRESVFSRLGSYLPAIKKIQESVRKRTLMKYLEKHWRLITPDFIVACSMIFPSLGAESDDTVAVLSSLQALTWFSMCAYWSDPEPGGSFEEDLQTYVVNSAILPSMLEYFEGVADAFWQNRGEDIELGYCMEAVRASIYRIAGRENPNGTRWAQLFVALEIQARSEQPVNPDRDRLRISIKRVRRTTTYRQLQDAIGLQLKARRDKQLEQIQQLVTELGYPELLKDAMGALEVTIQDGGELPGAAQMLDEALAALPPEEKTEESVSGALEAVIMFHPVEQPVEEYFALRDVARKHFPSTRVTQARIDVWLAEKLNALRHPRRVIELLRPEMFVDVDRLPFGVVTALFTEVGTAFRLMGYPDRALLAYDKVVEILEEDKPRHDPQHGSSDWRTAKRNLAIAHRECGAPDVALSILDELWESSFGRDEVPLLETFAATYVALGNKEKALWSIDAALERAVGPFEGCRQRLRSLRAMFLSANPDEAGLVEELLAISLPTQGDLSVLSSQACAWINILLNSDDSNLLESSAVEGRVVDLANMLIDYDEICRDRHDVQAGIIALTLLGYMYEILDDSKAGSAWSDLQDLSKLAGQGNNVYALFSLARLAYETGDLAEGRRLLEFIPQSFVSSIGQAQRLHMVARALSWHSFTFSRVARAVRDQRSSTFDDFRLIAEISRDTVRRAIRTGAENIELETAEPMAQSDFVAPYVENLMRLAPEEGVLGILEWISFGASMRALLTSISAGGKVESRWLEIPGINLLDLGQSVRAKLDFWTSTTQGDPFDGNDWREFESWLTNEIGKILPDESHLVVIEHQNFAGLPWHVAASSRWSCSYCSGWQALFEIVSKARDSIVRETCIGVACVGTFDEGRDLMRALHASAERTEVFARDNGYRCETAYDVDCDHARFADLLQTSTVLKILCHGYVSGQQDEVALMIAFEGSLPLKLPQAAETESGRAHRFSWRDVTDLDRCPQLVFSAACSSLRAHIVGQGERLGFSPSLYERGTRSFVAPAWDIEPDTALSVLDCVLESHLRQARNLGRILREECQRASSRMPRWLAWSLSIEGDWR